MAKSEQAVEKAQLNHKDTKSLVKNPGLLKKVWSAKKIRKKTIHEVTRTKDLFVLVSCDFVDRSSMTFSCQE